MDGRVKERLNMLRRDAKQSGYILNSDDEFVEGLAEGLIANADRYGIQSCPCRLFKGEKKDNYDIVCPCDYRDADLADFGACYCALYVSKPENSGKQIQVPERRPSLEQRRSLQSKPEVKAVPGSLAYPVWRCKVCGYLCANTQPPGVCPVCKAASERFERFM